MVRDERQQRLRGGIRPFAVFAEHEQQPMRGAGDDLAVDEIPIARHVRFGIQDVLRHHLLFRQPVKERGGVRFRLRIGRQFTYRQRHRFRLDGAHRGHLLLRRVTLARLAGDLDHQFLADRGAHRLDRIVVGARIEGVAPVGIAHVQMEHRRTRIEAPRRGVGKLRGGDRQSRMVLLSLVRAVGGHGKDQRRPGVIHATATWAKVLVNATVSLSTISVTCWSLIMKGGANNTWLPVRPSMVPPMG